MFESFYNLFILFHNRKIEHVRILNSKKVLKPAVAWTCRINSLFLVLTINKRNDQSSDVKVVQVYDDDNDYGNCGDECEVNSVEKLENDNDDSSSATTSNAKKEKPSTVVAS